MTEYELLKTYPAKFKNSDLLDGYHVWRKGTRLKPFSIGQHSVAGTDKMNWRGVEFLESHPEIFKPISK